MLVVFPEVVDRLLDVRLQGYDIDVADGAVEVEDQRGVDGLCEMEREAVFQGRCADGIVWVGGFVVVVLPLADSGFVLFDAFGEGVVVGVLMAAVTEFLDCAGELCGFEDEFEEGVWD